jgi:hypothetical protein
MFKLAVVVVFTTLAVTSSFAQVSASATASANIIAPLTITESANMNFGTLIPSSTAGTVVLSPAGALTPTNVTPSGSGVTAASFAITGTGSLTFSITLPADGYTITSSSNTMTLSSFSSSLGASGTLSSGAATLNVGATLAVGANQAAGSYTNGTGFQVTVNYN